MQGIHSLRYMYLKHMLTRMQGTLTKILKDMLTILKGVPSSTRIWVVMFNNLNTAICEQCPRTMSEDDGGSPTPVNSTLYPYATHTCRHLTKKARIRMIQDYSKLKPEQLNYCMQTNLSDFVWGIHVKWYCS